MDAVAFVRRAGHDLAQENDLVVPFAHRDVVVAHAGPRVGEGGHLVVVRGEEGARLQHVVQVLGDAPREAEPVEGAGAAPDLVEDDEAARGGVVDDERGLVHFDHEGALAARQIVAGADTGEDAVHQPDLRARRREEAADLRHQRQQGDLADIGRFARHIGAGDEQQARGFRLHRDIVGHEALAARLLVEHRMAAVLDVKRAAVVKQRAVVIEESRRFRQRGQDVQPRHRVRRVLQGLQRRDHPAPQLVEQLELQLLRPLLRAEDFVLDLLQLGRDEPLGIDHRLLAVVMRRHAGEVGLGDFDEIPEDRIVADLERLDAGGLDLARLELRDPFLALPGGGAQLVQRLVPASANVAAVFDGGRRLIGDRPQDVLRQRGEIAHRGEQFRRQRQRGRQFRQPLAQRRQSLQRERQRQQIAPVATAGAQPSERALDILHWLEPLAQRGQKRRPVAQGLDHILPRDQRLQVAQRVQDPLAQFPRAHRRLRAVERAQQRAFAPGAALHEIKMLPRRGVEHHEVPGLIRLQPPDVVHAALQRVLQIMQDRPRRAHRRRHARAAEAIQRLHLEMFAQGEKRLLVEKGIRVVGLRAAQRAEAILLLRAEQDLRRADAE